VNELGRELKRRIEFEGPIPVSAFMQAALYHPTLGYYRRSKPPIGACGDYITAPEVSQMFGELIGVWCVDLWRRMGAPKGVHLVEFGPGRGTLLKDLLRAVARFSPFRESIELHLVEISPSLRAAQKRLLRGETPHWHDDFSEIPPGPAIVIANEFFDALPIRQFVRRQDGWFERCVGLDDKGGFCFVTALKPADLSEELSARERPSQAPLGGIIEISAQARALAGDIAARIARSGGGALIIDYGPSRSDLGESLQAVHRHRSQEILARPGEVDLSAHVDFAALAAAARAEGCAVFGPIPQGVWLERMGIAARARALKAAARSRRPAIEAALTRLTAPTAMGLLFKVLALVPPKLGSPAGFG
jgi:NADH dehydrogenase [ubiquinone] 1 alpha subcomplex assembly factor 7